MKNIGKHPQGRGAPVEAENAAIQGFPADAGYDLARRIWEALTAVYAAENGIEVTATLKRRAAAV